MRASRRQRRGGNARLPRAVTLAPCATRRLGVGADGSALLRQERYDWSHIPNLDTFFVRLYVYFTDNGFVCSLVRAPEQPLARYGD